MHPRAIELQQRLLRFSVAIARICDALPNKISARRIAVQLMDSSTSSYANYRSACRGRSRAEFIAKLGIVVEELDESQGWLVMLQELEHLGPAIGSELVRETDQLLAIFTASILTAKSRSAAREKR